MESAWPSCAPSAGAAEIVNRRVTPEWAKAVGGLTGDLGVDHVVNAVGPAALEKCVLAAGFNGQIALLAAAVTWWRSGARSPSVAADCNVL
jgi:NADPH:quinone reductase-like Zn-dependent oxidoreductase